jgi:hypothetical protein
MYEPTFASVKRLAGRSFYLLGHETTTDPSGADVSIVLVSEEQVEGLSSIVHGASQGSVAYASGSLDGFAAVLVSAIPVTTWPDENAHDGLFVRRESQPRQSIPILHSAQIGAVSSAPDRLAISIHMAERFPAFTNRA